MPDDSVSEITDLDYEEVLHKYYDKKMSNIEKRRAERAASRKRLRGEPRVELKHKCKPNAKQMAKMGMLGGNDEVIEMELRQRSEGKSMQDEEMSAH